MNQIELHYPEYGAGDSLGYENWQEDLKKLKRIGKKILEFPLNKKEAGYKNWRDEMRQKQVDARKNTPNKDLFTQSKNEQGYQKWQMDVESYRIKQRQLAGLPIGKKAIIKLKEYAFPVEGVIQLTSKSSYKVDELEFKLQEIESVSVC